MAESPARVAGRAAAAIAVWAAVFFVVFFALGLVFGGATDVDGPPLDADVASVIIFTVAMVVAGVAATAYPRPVGAERWSLLAGPVALAVLALATTTPWWPTVVASVLGAAATAWLVLRRTASPPAAAEQRRSGW